MTPLTEEQTESLKADLQRAFNDGRDDWFCDFVEAMDKEGFDIATMPHDDFTRDVSNPHAARIARAISLMVQEVRARVPR